MACAVATSVRQNIEMESAIDRGAVASHEIARLLDLIAPSSQQYIIDPAGQRTRLRCRAKDHPRALARRAGQLPPKFIELLVRHPILGIEQDVAIKRSVRPASEVFGK